VNVVENNELEPAAYITEKSDYDAELVWDTEDSETGMIKDSLYTASDIIRHFELNELINQLAIAHRELQSLKDGGRDDTDRLDQRIEANQILQKKIEDFRESSQEVDD